MAGQFGQILLASLSPDKITRENATAQLESYSKENLPLYLNLLVTELAKEGGDVQVRQAAGLAAKNALTAKDQARKEDIKGKWFSLPHDIKQQVKQLALQSLGSSEYKIGSTAAQFVAAIAALDLPHGQWNELVVVLLNNVTANPSNTNLKRSSLETIGFICEDIDPTILAAQANQILTAVVSGARPDQPNEVRLAALVSLYNSLEFVRENFQNEGERNYIMQVVCEATQCPDKHVQVAAFEALVKIMSLYYDLMQPYMERALFALTVEAMKSENEGVALQAVEFWSTICDEEIDLAMEMADANALGQQPERRSRRFAEIGLPHTIPVLTHLLTKQAEEDDEDDWNVAMAASTCLSLMANCVQDSVVRYVLPFIEQNIGSSDWRYKEAAVMSFGSILEGPNPDTLKPIVVQALPVLISLMNDPSIQVQDTTAWTLGRICDLLPEAIDVQTHLPALIQVLLQGLQRAPRVASNCAWSIMNLTEQMGEDSEYSTFPLTPYFDTLVGALLQTTERPDGDESNLRTAAYETLSSLVQNASSESKQTIINLTQAVLEKLQKSIQNERQLLSVEDRLAHSELQANLCALIQSIIRKLEGDVRMYADVMMQSFLQMFASSSGQHATILEDALLAVGSLTVTLEKDFARYIDTFLPFLCAGLQNHQEYQVCSISVGLVGDICRALGELVQPYCNTFMTYLLQNLQSPVLHRSVKPPILSCFGDIALAIGQKFGSYLDICMTILQQACAMKANEDDYDMIEYVNQLREGIFEAYTGIVQGMKNPTRLLPFTEHMINFIREVHLDSEKSDAVTRGAVGLLGDLCDLLGHQIAPILARQDWVQQFVKECVQSKNQSTKEVANWTKDALKKAMH